MPRALAAARLVMRSAPAASTRSAAGPWTRPKQILADASLVDACVRWRSSFPRATIERERFCGLTKSLIAIR